MKHACACVGACVADWLKLSEIKVSMRAKLMAKVAPEGNLTYKFTRP